MESRESKVILAQIEDARLAFKAALQKIEKNADNKAVIHNLSLSEAHKIDLLLTRMFLVVG